MIISHRHRFIFIKTRKTASTSVELFLRQFCGPDDVITRDAHGDERLARRLGVPGQQNSGSRPVMPWNIRGNDIWWARRNGAYPQRAQIGMHADAAAIRDFVGPTVWSSYTKITTVRDPWETTVSLYFWRKATSSQRVRNAGSDAGTADAPGRTLDDAVERAARNWATYTIDDVPVVDHVVRYERLDDDLDSLCTELRLEPRIPLQAAKGGIRPAKTAAVELLSIVQARRVAELAQREIEWLGYTWSGPDFG